MNQITLANWCRDCHGKYYPEIKAWILKYEIPSHTIFEGDELEIINDCLSADYMHEVTNYPREGLIRKELKAGDVVTFKDVFQNFYGEYCVVTKDGILYHVEPSNLKILHPYTKDSLAEKVYKLRFTP